MRTPLAARIGLGIVVALVLAFLVVPILIIIPMSFSDARFLTFPPPAYSLRWYQAFFGSSAWMEAARVSLILAVAATIGATLIGTAAAYALAMTQSRWVRRLTIVLLLPLIVPVVIIAIGVFFVFAKLGLLATIPGLVLANVMLGTPYVVTSVLAGLRSFDPAQEMVARSLGMNRLRAFLTVTLPQIRPSVISGALFAFISALDETVVAIFISGGQNQTLTKRMFTSLRDEIDPTIAAISSLLTAASLVILLVTMTARRSDGAT